MVEKVATITVSGVVVRNASGKVLTVRKRGTSMFMLPGGKPEPGENPLNAALRELGEELEMGVHPEDLDFVGVARTRAANEPDTGLYAALFVLREPVDAVRLAAELEEFRWVDPDDAAGHGSQAPLNVDHVFPLLRGKGAGEPGRISLRRLTLEDAPTHNAGEDAESVRWLTEGVASTEESTRAWISRQPSAFDTGRGELVFGVRVDGNLAGMVTINQTPAEDVFGPGEVNVSYAIYPAYRGRGVGRQAVELMLDFARIGGRFESALVRVDPANLPSVRLAASLDRSEFAGVERRRGSASAHHYRVPLR